MELTPELTAEHRLAVIETHLDHISSCQKEIKDMLKVHTEAACLENCATAKDLIAVKTAQGNYQKLTWATFVLMLSALVKVFWHAA